MSLLPRRRQLTFVLRTSRTKRIGAVTKMRAFIYTLGFLLVVASAIEVCEPKKLINKSRKSNVNAVIVVCSVDRPVARVRSAVIHRRTMCTSPCTIVTCSNGQPVVCWSPKRMYWPPPSTYSTIIAGIWASAVNRSTICKRSHRTTAMCMKNSTIPPMTTMSVWLWCQNRWNCQVCVS